MSRSSLLLPLLTAPLLGNTDFVITLENAVAGAVPILTSFVAPAVSGGGASELQFSIPTPPQLEGRRMFAQWAIPDAAGGISFGGSNYAASEGLELFLSANQL